MKPMSLLAICGIVVSSVFAAPLSHADQPHAKRPRSQQETAHVAPPSPPQPLKPIAPRGDLRGDIASNARTRGEPLRSQDNLNRH
ncbi:hypothetical protein [Burkholderia alba]|uniref:hypothetical protein n=1 Tax=Burkholderia alba TaxID=2683677 RepID=UPI002B061898|nr:hypothetical protein [Burkholderia alba]